MKVTLIHPAIGRRAGDRRYIRSWQMEPLPLAVIAALTPPDVEVAFYDDRLEAIPTDAPTDLVAISVETYTARRAYQIASDYRRRGVPVVMGGFHATLCPDEVARYADAVVVGEAEDLWPRLLDDFQAGALQPRYQQDGRPSLARVLPDRSIFRGKRYLPVRLVETGRGCPFGCEFCAVQSFFRATHQRRPVEDVVRELRSFGTQRQFVFFVDDNIVANKKDALELFRALKPLRIRWVSQASITAAFDDELLGAMADSGCRALLIGFESLDPETLRSMNKGFNQGRAALAEPLARLRRHGIRLYATFLFGYDRDTAAAFDEALEFANEQAFFLAAFNHLTPFPGTPLYRRLEEEGRLLFDRWWLDRSYGYNRLPFRPKLLAPDEVERRCLETRQAYYARRNIARRFRDPLNRTDLEIARNFWLINLMIRREVLQRDALPLGNEDWRGELLEVRPVAAAAR